MAAGDVVNGYLASSASFQPAAGVEILITSWFANGATAMQIGLTGGGTAYNYVGGTTGTGAGAIMMNIKFFITNTRFLLNVPSGVDAGYTGIQIK